MKAQPSTRRFQQAIYELVRAIPAGNVSTYGQLAVLAGRPRNARLVGQILSRCPKDVPAHRVVNHAGRTVPGWEEQRTRLQQEGITFRPNGMVDLTRHRWNPLALSH